MPSHTANSSISSLYLILATQPLILLLPLVTASVPSPDFTQSIILTSQNQLEVILQRFPLSISVMPPISLAPERQRQPQPLQSPFLPSSASLSLSPDS